VPPCTPDQIIGINRYTKSENALASAAYVLIEHLRRVALRGTELARAQVTTIRLKLFKIAARVVTSVRRVVFHLSSSYPYRFLLRQLTARLTPT